MSASDLSKEIAKVAKEVHIASKYVEDDTYEKQPGYDNIWLHSMIERVREDGTVVFRDGSLILADVVIHCTGYKYFFPFLKTDGILTVDDNRVGPLYKHVFPPSFAPRLSFVGIPYDVFPFPTFEVQSKWIAGVLSGRITLPSKEDMMEEVKDFYTTLEASGIPKQYTHRMVDSGYDYNASLASLCQCPSYEQWRIQIFHEAVKNRLLRPITYRDEWEDDDLVLQAHENFRKRCRLS